jgi:hypothetical protein
VESRTRERIESRTLPLIRTWFSDVLVSGFDPAREVGATDAKDRHVASAAAAISPCVLVTENLRHFDAKALEGLGVTLRSPDDFLCDRFDAKPNVVEAATREAAANLTKNLLTWEEYLGSIAKRCRLTKFADRLPKMDAARGSGFSIRVNGPPPSLPATDWASVGSETEVPGGHAEMSAYQPGERVNSQRASRDQFRPPLLSLAAVMRILFSFAVFVMRL